MGGFRDGRRGDRRLGKDLDEDLEKKRERKERRLAPGRRTLTGYLKAKASEDAIAEAGTRGTPVAFPHKATIEAAFGRTIDATAHIDDESAAAAQALDTEAFAHGNRVGFQADPSLFVAAHEAAHTLQTAGSVRAFSGDSDAFETHANLAAARVVAGMSAVDLFTDHSAPGASVVRRLTPPGRGTTMMDTLLRQNYVELVPRIAKILTELGELAKFDISTGVFEGDLSLGIAATIIRSLAPSGAVGGLDELDGGSIVHLRLDVYHQTFALTAVRLHVLPGTIGLVSGDVILEDVALRGKPFQVTLDVGEVVAINGSAVRDSDTLQIDSLHLRNLHAYVRGSLHSIATSATFREAHVHGLRVPGKPILDLDVMQAHVGVVALWDSLWDRLRSKAIGLYTDHMMRRAGLAGPGRAPAPSASPDMPNPLPAGSRVHVTINNLFAKARENTPFDHDVTALLEGLRMSVVDRDNQSLASVSIIGVTARKPPAKPGIILHTVTITGSPAFVPALLDSDTPMLPHEAKAALEKLRAHFAYLAHDQRGEMTMTLGPIHLDIVGGLEHPELGEMVVDDVDLELRDGTTRLFVSARDLKTDLRTRNGKIPTITAHMFDNDREVVAVTITNFQQNHSVDAKKQKHTIDTIETITITGNAGRAPHLLAAIRKQNPALPKDVLAALASAANMIPAGRVTIRGGGAKVDQHGGTTDVELTKTLVAKIVSEHVGTLIVEVTGAHATDDDAQTSGGFDRFTATLTSAEGGKVTTLRARGGHATKKHDKSAPVADIPVITVDGDTLAIGDLLDTLANNNAQLPPAIRKAADIVLYHRASLGATFHAEATGVHLRGSNGKADGVRARVELSKHRGVVLATMTGARREGNVPKFDLLELTLENKPGSIIVRKGYVKDEIGAGQIEVTAGSDEILPILEPAMLELLPANLAGILLALKSVVTHAVMNKVKVKQPKGGGFEVGAEGGFTMHADLELTTDDGTKYSTKNAVITMELPTGSFKDKTHLHAETLTIAGAFTITSRERGTTTGSGTITMGPADLVDSAAGMRVTGKNVTINVHTKNDKESEPVDKGRALATAEEHAGDLRHLRLLATVPLKPARFIPAGTEMQVEIETEGKLLALAKVSLNPPIVVGSMTFDHGQLQTDVRGLVPLLAVVPTLAKWYEPGLSAELARLFQLAGDYVAASVVTAHPPRSRDPDTGWAVEDKPQDDPPLIDFKSLVDINAARGTLDAAIATNDPIGDPVMLTTELHGTFHGTTLQFTTSPTTGALGRDRVGTGPTSGKVKLDSKKNTIDVTDFVITTFTWDRAP